jgi:stage V sporulation protein G
MKSKTLNITAEVKKLFNDGGKAKALVSVNFDGLFVVRGARLVDGAKGMFVSMPSRKNAEGEYKAVCFPITEDFRVRILDAVKTAYEKTLTERESAGEDSEGGKSVEAGGDAGSAA